MKISNKYKVLLKTILIDFSILILAGFFLNSCASLEKNNNEKQSNPYEFKLEKPQSNELNLLSNELINVKISFDEKKVNSEKSYFAILIDNKLTSTKYSRQFTSPYEDKFNSNSFKEGSHTIDYLLMPSNSTNTNQARAGLRIKINVADTFNDKDIQSINSCVNEMIQYIQKNNAEKFSSLFIQKDQCKELEKNINEDKNAKEAAKEFAKNIASNKFSKNSKKGFIYLQNLLEQNKADRTTVEFKMCYKGELQFKYDNTKVIQITTIMQSDKFYPVAKCSFLIIKGKAYLLKFEPIEQFIPR